MEKTIKINLGCGADYKEGYFNVDSDRSIKADAYANIFKLTADYGKVDEILLSHVAMYIKPDEMEVLLKRWYEWLNKGGKLIIETIDLDKMMKFALEGRTDEWSLVNIFGTEKTGTHRWGWSIDKLKRELIGAGFKTIKQKKGLKKPNRDYQLIAIK